LNTQPSGLVSVLIAIGIHVAAACVVLSHNDAEELKRAELGQDMNITLNSDAYQNMMQQQTKAQEQRQKELAVQKKVEPTKPKKVNVVKRKKVKVQQQTVVTEPVKKNVVAYQVQAHVEEESALSEVAVVLDAISLS